MGRGTLKCKSLSDNVLTWKYKKIRKLYYQCYTI